MVSEASQLPVKSSCNSRRRTGVVLLTFENLAILFTDLVGSTKLLHGPSPAAAHEIRRELLDPVPTWASPRRRTSVRGCHDGVPLPLWRPPTKATERFWCEGSVVSAWARAIPLF